ncbi:MAG: LysM peptidoglycan-binding domain-containing protein [Luteolibacter sp.]
MKPTLLFATLSMIFASPTASAKSELETLRARCAEQERQIAQLEQDNSNLRSTPAAPHTLGSTSELISAAAAKPAEATKVSEARQPAATPDNAVYTVKAGDSIEKIAAAVKSTPTTLAKINGIKTNAIIHPGQKLKVPGTAPAAAKSEPSAPSKAPAVAASSVSKKYKVQDNDTFSSISRKQKVSVASLMAANPSVKPTALHTGQIINLDSSKPASVPPPVAKTSTPAPATQPATNKVTNPDSFTPLATAKSRVPNSKTSSNTEPATTAKAAVTPAPPASAKPVPAAPAIAAQESSSPNPDKKIHPVTIEGEITYGEFAAKNGTSPERLNALNGLDLTHATVLAKGSELYVPAQP